MNDIERDELITETHDTVTELKVILLGKNSTKGLCQKVEENCKDINIIKLVLVAILSSGVLGGGILGIVKLINGG